MAHYHHEKWNGEGYPEGLKGEQIPLSARIMAVADVFDALVSRRSYKDGMPFEKAMDIIKEGSGSHFDPQIVKAFVDSEAEVRKIAEDRNSDK
jgi:HD-GYP domain-containing protein (c-di-GMP phosphodiesterase class II)